MGGGSWTTKAFSDYTSRSRGVSLDEFDTMAFSAQEFYTSRKLDAALNPVLPWYTAINSVRDLRFSYYYNAPSLATRLTGDYRDRTYTGKCSPALLDTHKK